MKTALMLFVCVILSGCATVFASGPDHVPVASIPVGARVFLDGRFIGNAPITVPIRHSDDGLLRIEMDGKEPVTIDLDKSINPMTGANVLLAHGAVIGILVDVATGHIGKYPTEQIVVQLVDAKGSTIAEEVVVPTAR